MISHDLNFLQKFISFVHAFPGTSSNRGETTEEKIIGVKELMTLQCAVNLLFLMKQLKIYDFKPYREWIDKLRHQKCILGIKVTNHILIAVRD